MKIARVGNKKAHDRACYATGGRVGEDISDPGSLPMMHDEPDGDALKVEGPSRASTVRARAERRSTSWLARRSQKRLRLLPCLPWVAHRCLLLALCHLRAFRCASTAAESTWMLAQAVALVVSRRRRLTGPSLRRVSDDPDRSYWGQTELLCLVEGVRKAATRTERTHLSKPL
jgi:hypothetical protein